MDPATEGLIVSVVYMMIAICVAVAVAEELNGGIGLIVGATWPFTIPGILLYRFVVRPFIRWLL